VGRRAAGDCRAERSRVRVQAPKLRPPDTLVTQPSGYVLQVGPDELDLTRFEREVADARASLEAGDAERGSRVLHDALELWRGPALAEFAYEAFARTEIARLEEVRVAALEDRIEADLSLGRHAEVISELESLIAANPQGERPREQLMVALYRSGRQAEALEAYQAVRKRLDELGLEPGERLRQLEKAILTHDAVLKPPPQKVPKRAHTNLPVPATSLVGRKQQLAEVIALLSDDATRLVTLTGAAGSGKTRLALQAAHDLHDEFPHGVFFVGLETVRDPAFVVPAIAKALGVTASPGEALERALRERLAAHRVLIVLDNFEQVLAAAPIIAGLLTTSAAFLVTSRAPIRIAAEREYPVPPLTLAEARELFVHRARAVVPAFEPSPAVAEVCRRLDCLPLAIELAAARTKILSPGAIVPRLDRRLSLLTGGPSDLPTRQRTLRAALDWSYELLTKPERRLFARLAVFAGGLPEVRNLGQPGAQLSARRPAERGPGVAGARVTGCARSRLHPFNPRWTARSCVVGGARRSRARRAPLRSRRSVASAACISDPTARAEAHHRHPRSARDATRRPVLRAGDEGRRAGARRRGSARARGVGGARTSRVGAPHQRVVCVGVCPAASVAAAASITRAVRSVAVTITTPPSTWAATRP
jgi:DNA-binding SARP family transcriptional activator